MPSKAELDAEIVRLKQVIATQERALRMLSADEGVEVAFPFAKHGMETGVFAVHGVGDVKGEVLGVIWDVVHAHGIPMKGCPGAVSGKEMVPVRGDGFSSGARFIVPTLAAEVMAGMVNRIADYGASCYKSGFSEGSSILRQLAAGQISASDLEDRSLRAMATAVPKSRRLVVRKKPDWDSR